MAKEKHLLFPITDKDLRVEYEELGSVEEFKELTNKEMSFVWYYANQTSPYAQLPSKDRVLKCLEILKDELSSEQLEEYYALNFPSHIDLAIEVMARFNPRLRSQAKDINETIFRNVKRIVSVNPDELTDMKEKKEYIAISMDVIKSMPELINQLEQGFGVRTKGKKKDAPQKEKTTWDEIMGED